MKKIILKNFKYNFKKYILFFLCNVFATIEITAFLGFKSIVKKAIKDSSIMLSMYVDFKLAEKIIIIITAMMMAYAMSLYLKLRANDYTNFMILGMRRKRAYRMIIFEYLIGWLGSFSIGLLLGYAAVMGGQHLLELLFLGLITITSIGLSVFLSVVKISVVVMLITFFLLMLWLEDRDLSNMAKKESSVDKRRSLKIGAIMVIVSIVLAVIGYALFQSHEFQHASAFVVWSCAGFVFLLFSIPVFFQQFKRWTEFYYKNILKMNPVYTRYTRNSLLILIIFTVHFFALSYVASALASAMPIQKFKTSEYPYDAVWHSSQIDVEQGERISEKYEGQFQHIKAIRLTSYNDSRQIAISADTFKRLTGRKININDDREIVVVIEERGTKKEAEVNDKEITFCLKTLYAGKYNSEKSDYILSMKYDKRYEYNIKHIYRHTVIGQYSDNHWEGNLVIFSDSEFKRLFKQMSENKTEPTELMLFRFPGKYKSQAYRELKRSAVQGGCTGVNISGGAEDLYLTQPYTEQLRMYQAVNLMTKGTILIALLLSAVLVLIIKLENERGYLNREYWFLHDMGMRKRMIRHTMMTEIESIPRIALSVSTVLALVHAAALDKLCKNGGDSWGITVTGDFWNYILVIAVLYIITIFILQRIYSYYAVKSMERMVP